MTGAYAKKTRKNRKDPSDLQLISKSVFCEVLALFKTT